MRDILIALSILLVGFCLGFGLHMVMRRMASYAGTIHVIREEDKLTYSLELNEDPAIIEHVDEVVFKVVSSEVEAI